ncbi:MAG: ribosome biogenesis GTP-binding protein YihA/YsxC [Oscillospiraceae bacterium]|jgi:GTP-binding protein|nr:ribosome biogenesis GTP-binding protein YihA/YsxC [Oscillospiraceae bacterium]
MPINYRETKFIKSAASERDLVQTSVPVVAFSGKSNVGKSSVINRLLDRANFARVGATPGKTAHINYFDVNGKILFADLPGYGFAKVSKTERDRWAQLCESFFGLRLLTLGIMIVDARHKPTADDAVMAGWYRESECAVVVVANKVDKVKKSELAGNLAVIEETLALPGAEIIPFSAETGLGREKLAAAIERLV